MLVSLGNGQPLPASDVGARSSPAECGGPGYSPMEVPDRRTALPGGGVPVAAVAVQNPVLSTDISRHRRRWFWIALCAAVALAGGAGVALTSHNSGTHKPAGTRASGASQTARGGRTPSAVVKAYFGAINAHNWGKVWQLGGKNLGPSYASMVAGFQDTSRDVITRMTADGDAVTVRIRAYQTTGVVQIYVLSHTVSGDVIAGGHQTLISAQTPCPHIQYGADGTAGPLFCNDGQPNPPVLAYYRTLHLQVLSLGPDAAPAQVRQAICTDVHRHSTYPIETAAYNLAQKINGWSFGISPPQEMLNGACR